VLQPPSASGGARTVKYLREFTVGQNHFGPLVMDENGVLYGTTGTLFTGRCKLVQPTGLAVKCGADLQVCAGSPEPAPRVTKSAISGHEQAGVGARRRPGGPPHETTVESHAIVRHFDTHSSAALPRASIFFKRPRNGLQLARKHGAQGSTKDDGHS